MIRSVLYGFALITGAVLAVLWVYSPRCAGSFCLGSSETSAPEASAPQAGVTTSDLERIWEESEPVRQGQEAVSAELAVVPLEEPQVSPEQPAPVDQAGLNTDGTADAANPDQTTGELRNPEAAERWVTLASAALSEPDPELRGEAVHEVGLHRSAEAVSVLIEVAADDPDPDNRYQALEQLWYSAADGLDGDGAITRTLEAALGDPDEDIAELAERALADLAKLAQAE